MRSFRHRRPKDQKWVFANGKYQPVLLEEHVLREIVERLWWHKIKVWRIRERIPGQGGFSTPGIPDLIGWAIRRDWTPNTTVPLFIEVKRPGGVRRPAQERWIAEAKADGCIAFFAESWEDVVRELKTFGLEAA